MPQYRTGTVTISGESQVVLGAGTSWLTNVSTGHTFKKKSENAIYEVATVINDTEIRLTTNYQGSGESGVEYQIVKDFTPNLELPEVWAGDVDWRYHLTQALRLLDQYLSGTKYASNFSVSGELSLRKGKVPVVHVDDEIKLFAVESSDGDATLGIFLEQEVVVTGEATNITHKVKVNVNGVEYWIQLTAV